MHDKFKKHRQVSRVDSKLRKQIAREAARRMIAARRRPDGEEAELPTDLLWLDEAVEADYHAAKRKAVTVLGHRVRPGDLPTDEEVRAQVVACLRSGEVDLTEESEVEESPAGSSEFRLERFTLYRLKLQPLESVKQNPKTHPEGDALYHSLQVFERAREVQPHDEEFLLAALLHDIGKAIDSSDHVRAGVDALRGSVTDRTLWLIEHHMHLCSSPKYRRPVETDDEKLLEDLKLLRELDEAGRVPGVPVGTVEEALGYLQSLIEEFGEE